MSRASATGLESVGLEGLGTVHWNLTAPSLYEEAVRRSEAMIAQGGALVATTAPHTGRSPNDKFLVREKASENDIWWGRVNRAIEPQQFDALLERMRAYYKGREAFVQDVHAGADPRHRLPVRVVTEQAWQSLFARNMFLPADAAAFAPQFTVLQAPGLKAEPSEHGTNSETFILLSFEKRLVLIGGTRYAGEIKKSVFTVLNYLLPAQGVLPMHCSANVGGDGDVALFFGLSGTGKTTLSADPRRRLVGDDEHGWSDRGVFNFEGGCYAKVIRLSAEAEPQIHATTRRFGTILENVVVDPVTRAVDLDDGSITENTRASYPIGFIDGSIPAGTAGHPSHVFFLTCDAFGVLPPISKLSPAQAMYHFLAGYTAKVAGTERGVKDPTATFSTCFGAPFLPRPPSVYARMLGGKLTRHKAQCWLVNTGWTGGPFGVGSRMRIAHTRATLDAALTGALDDVPMDPDPIFGLHVPAACPGVPKSVLHPSHTWPDKEAYRKQATKLANLFREAFREFEKDVTDDVRAAGPAV
ncbi:MAG TPA: phosphoenolpyruvate carboxykinase [Planctomycetota bacterium]|nr:phosphoenolpyruvate carboxykinase [Planctomycetota bacterium]